MPLFLSLYAFGLIGFFIHGASLPKSVRGRKTLVELFLLYQLVFSVGCTSLMAFFGLTFLPDYIAQITEWPPCPFEQQLANVNLAFGVLGILSIWFRDSFWMATIIGFSIWILSDGIQHLYHAMMRGNYSTGNVGVPLYTDIFIPLLLLALLITYRKQRSSNHS